VRVFGRVQGVFFRAECAERAGEHALAGWVRNLPGGGVEASFEGAPRAVEALIAWCRIGPARARVDDVQVTDELPIGESGFRVEP
jgi:acylphosphatase